VDIIKSFGAFLELKYSENQVGHSEKNGNNSITKF
jgi:hypothetical protein